VLFPVGERGLILAFVHCCGTKAWVDFGSARFVTYRACSDFLLLHMGVFRVFKFTFVTYQVSMIYPAKKILFVLYRAFSQKVHTNAVNIDKNGNILSFIDFFLNIMRWQKTSGLANQSSPTLTTPNIKNYHQIIFCYIQVFL